MAQFTDRLNFAIGPPEGPLLPGALYVEKAGPYTKWFYGLCSMRRIRSRVVFSCLVARSSCGPVENV